MKEIVNGIWNAPKEEVYQSVNNAMIGFGVITIISIALSCYLYRIAKKKWNEANDELKRKFDNPCKYM